MRKLDDLTGRKYGSLTVKAIFSKIKNGTRYLCICDCGKEHVARGYKLVSGDTKSCGCIAKINVPDETGQQYGYLKVIRQSGQPGRFECLCVCGKTLTLKGNQLRGGGYQSCGCRKSELIKTASVRLAGLGPRFDPNKKTSWPEYRVWNAIKCRCYQPSHKSYHRYGGAGILMSEEWRKSFDAFYRDMGPRPSQQHSIDRIDNSLGYSKWNCRWATKAEQNYNRSVSITVELEGRSVNLAVAALEVGVPYEYARKWIKRGLTIQEIALRHDKMSRSHSPMA